MLFRIILITRYLLWATTAILAIMWIVDSKGNYEPWTVLAGISGIVMETWAHRIKPRNGIVESNNADSPQILVPISTLDIIAKGEAGAWDSIVESFKDGVNRVDLSATERLPLIVSYDIQRAKKVQEYPKDLVFLDSSWIAHNNYSYWTDDPNMSRWLKALGEVSRHRAKRGRRTARVFYWRPDEVKLSSEVTMICNTILSHINAGIEVTLVEPRYIPILDAQLFSSRDAIISRDFSQLSLHQLVGTSQVSEVTDHIEKIKQLLAKGNALHFNLNMVVKDVYRQIVQACPNLKGNVRI